MNPGTRFAFVWLPFLALCSASALAEGTDASRPSADLVQPAILPLDDGLSQVADDACRRHDADGSLSDTRCDSPDPIGGDLSSWLVNETVRGFLTHTGSGYQSPSAITAATEPEEWHAGPGAETGKAKPFTWTPAKLAIVAPRLLEAGQSSFHPSVTGASIGLFASLALAAKKLLVLLVASFAALWAASRRCEPTG